MMSTPMNPPRRLVAALWILSLVPALTGCASMNAKTKGAIVGATTGGLVGGAIGHKTGSTARGAIIGAVVGGAAGAIIGHQMDQRAKELEQAIPGARVSRVGEGIAVTFDSGLLFDFDSDAVRGNARSNLDALAANINKYGDSDLMIVGHTDATGSDAYNMGLSRRRANAAKNYLRSQGVGRPITALGRGEDEPIASNDTEEGRGQNRRVEVAIYASRTMRAEARRQAGSE